jgi:2-hydroxy-3-keto-5-methylthiopentenyl-1-phosphate phosphatase
MKKKWVFISDFDGTITAKDFYWILLDDYIGRIGIDFYHEWKKNKKIGTEFLNTVFSWKQLTNLEKEEALSKVWIDPNLENVVSYVENHGGDFWILSAGFDYYIKDALARRGLDRIPLFTNPGEFANHHFRMLPDVSSPYYSPVYGIDKEKVALEAKTRYKTVIFAGDSEPDLYAAIHADVIFAKHELAKLLTEKKIAYYTYNDFKDIALILNTMVTE